VVCSYLVCCILLIIGWLLVVVWMVVMMFFRGVFLDIMFMVFVSRYWF